MFSGVMLLRYRAQDMEKGKVGRYIKKTLADAERTPGTPVLYKVGTEDLYGELFYSGARVKRIHSTDDLPDSTSGDIYLLSSFFPQNPRNPQGRKYSHGFQGCRPGSGRKNHLPAQVYKPFRRIFRVFRH